MKRLIPMIILIPALLLAGGCATTPSPATATLEPGHAGSAGVAFGTLASFGTFEMETAPVITRNAVARHNAARAVRQQKITADQGTKLLALTDRVRAYLEQAHAAAPDGKETPEAREYLDKAIAMIEAIEGKLP